MSTIPSDDANVYTKSNISAAFRYSTPFDFSLIKERRLFVESRRSRLNATIKYVDL